MNVWRNKWFTCNWWLSKEIRALTDYLCFQVQNFTFLSDRTSLSINIYCYFSFKCSCIYLYIIVVEYNMLFFQIHVYDLYYSRSLRWHWLFFFCADLSVITPKPSFPRMWNVRRDILWPSSPLEESKYLFVIFSWNKCFCILYFDIKCPELGNKWICLSDKVCICLLVCLWMFDVLNFFCTCITCQQLHVATCNPFLDL